MTRIIFDGADKPSHRVLLDSMGVKHQAFSFWRARQRGFPKTKPYRLAEYFQPDTTIVVDSGWTQVEKAGWTPEETLQYVDEYEAFIANNREEIAGATELHLRSMGMDWIHAERERWGEDMGDLIWPIWDPEDGQLALSRLAEKYGNVAIPNNAVGDPLLPSRINSLARQYQTEFHALNTAKPDLLKSAKFATASTISWASPQMRGETIVWDGQRIVRYPKKMKDQARARYKNVVESAGLDFNKVVQDDPTEVTRLAIWSYKQLEQSMIGGDDQGVPSNYEALTPSEMFGGNQGGVVDKKTEGARNAVQPREASEKRALPVFGVEYKQIVETENGRDVVKEVPVLRSKDESLRQCNSCILADKCPAFTPDSMCAFGLPVEVKTKEQLRALLNAMIEMQGQRIAFARFAEELNGGYPDPNLSQEIDRLFKLVKNVKELESNNEFIRITAERQTSGGVLSALFGDKAEVLRELPQPVQSDDVIQAVVERETPPAT